MDVNEFEGSYLLVPLFLQVFDVVDGFLIELTVIVDGFLDVVIILLMRLTAPVSRLTSCPHAAANSPVIESGET